MAQNKTTYRKTTPKKHTKSRGITIALIAFVRLFAFAWNGYKNSRYYQPVQGDKPQHNEAEPQGVIVTSKVTDNTGVLDTQQIQLLENYGLLYAQTLQSLNPRDVSTLYADSDSAHCAVNNVALKLLADVRSKRDIDLTLEYATVEYIVETATKNRNEITITLKESNTQKFRHLSQPSLNANINHTFVLTEQNGKWLIKSHQQEEDFYLLIAEGWEDATGQTNHLRRQNAYDLIMADASENLADISQFQQGKVRDLKVADTSYNRDAAVEYASRWWNKRNYTGHYLAYDDFGGNCQNFASQCIHAGGIKMDYTGVHDVQWKFYDENLNNKATARGRSYSWTGVDMFYSYALNNYSDGLVSLTDIPYSYAEKGDIVHVGAYYQWRHALLVTDVLKNADGSLQDIVVASNTADRWNYPLSAYIYTGARLIHILGQN